MMKSKISSNFSDIETWVFDLDNTLYPPSCNLFAQIDKRMTNYICTLLNVPHETARKIQKDFYHDYGTTLKGLMDCYQIDADDFLNHVHDIDYSWLSPNPTLAQILARLGGRKIIFTNGSRRHAENALAQMGLDSLFEAIFDIKDANYMPKPERASYEKFLHDFAIDPCRAVMFEDLARNLEVPHALGLRTVLVVPDEPSHQIHKPQIDMVDFVTDDLSLFLHNLSLI